MDLIWPKLVCAASEVKCKFVKAKAANISNLPEGFTVTCHAGAMMTPANSLYSVRAAVEWGAQVIEFDVSFRPDGTPVIIHSDAPGENEGVYLENALEIARKSNAFINLDIKSTANLGAVDELVKLKGMSERVFYTGVFEDWVETVRENSVIPYYLNHKITEEESKDKSAAQAVADKAKFLGAIGINSNHNGASKLFVDTMHENGLLVSLWTVNKIPDMINVLKLRPDNITTKKPNTFKNLILKNNI